MSKLTASTLVMMNLCLATVSHAALPKAGPNAVFAKLSAAKQRVVNKLVDARDRNAGKIAGASDGGYHHGHCH